MQGPYTDTFTCVGPPALTKGGNCLTVFNVTLPDCPALIRRQLRRCSLRLWHRASVAAKLVRCVMPKMRGLHRQVVFHGADDTLCDVDGSRQMYERSKVPSRSTCA